MEMKIAEIIEQANIEFPFSELELDNALIKMGYEGTSEERELLRIGFILGMEYSDLRKLMWKKKPNR